MRYRCKEKRGDNKIKMAYFFSILLNFLPKPPLFSTVLHRGKKERHKSRHFRGGNGTNTLNSLRFSLTGSEAQLKIGAYNALIYKTLARLVFRQSLHHTHF